MSVRRRQNWQGQQRVDVPHLKSVESAISNDFDELISGLVIGEDQSYIVRGFAINIPGSIGSSANGLQLLVEDSAFLHGGSDESGTFFTIPIGTPAEVLSSTTNTRVEGAFTPSTDNYIGIEFVRAVDDATADQVYFWNPTTNVEITKTIPLAIILDYKIVISTSSFASNVMPVSIVQTDASNNVISITDRRPLLYRLGTAGDASPDPFYSYPWSEGRLENFYTSTSSTSDPFLGGDKQITNMKDFFDALMTEFKALKGTPFWYSPSTGSISRLRQDASNTAFTGKGNVVHGPQDFQGQVAGMTTNVIVKTTGFSAPAGIVITGDGASDIDALIAAYNIANPDDTIFLFGGDGTQIINNAVPLALTSKAGQLNWDADTYLNFIGGRLRYTITENTETTDITLADNEVAYLNLVRGVAVIPNLIFTNGGTVVTSVGTVNWTADLVAGDFIKDASKGDENYYEILSIDSLAQVTLTTPFLETSSGLAGFDAHYSFGVYESNPAPSTNRHIQVSDRSLVPFDEDTFWLFFRQDDTGSVVKVYARVLGGQELEQGEAQNISDNTSLDILNFIGAASETDNSPDYTNSIIAAIAEVTTVTSDLAANFTTGQYFRINSAGDTNQYYVWVNKDTGGGDPTPAGLTSLEVAVTTGESAITTAGSLSAAINGLSDFDSVDNLDGTFTVTNALKGITTDAVNVDMGGAFSVVVDTQGVGEANHNLIDGEHLVRSIKRLDQATYSASVGLSKLARQNANSKLINGGVWSWDLGTTTLANTALAHIQIPGLNDERNEIAIQSIVLANDNDVAYIERNLDIGPDAVVPVSVAQIHTIVMTDDTYVIARREGNDVIVGSNSTKLEDGEEVRLYSARSSFDNQDKNKKMVGGGTWSYLDNTVNKVLTWSADAHVQVSGLADTDNIITAATIIMDNATDVAYINVNRKTGGGAHTPTVANINTIDDNNDDLIIIARRSGANVIVDESFLLKEEEFLELDGALAEINRHHGQLVVRPANPITDRIRISGSDILKLSGTQLSLEQKNLLLAFDGAVIDFGTGEVFESDGLTPANGGANDFTPFVVGANEYFYYSVSVLPNIANADNTISGQVLVIPATASNAVLANAPKAPFPSSGLKLANVWIKANAVAGVPAVATLTFPTNIILTSVAVGTARNGNTFTTSVDNPNPHPTDEIHIAFYNTASSIICQVRPNDGTNNGAVPVDLTTAELVELINTGAVVGKNTVIIDGSGFRTLQTATGGDGSVFVDGGLGDGVSFSFGGGVDASTVVEDIDYTNIIQLGVGGGGGGGTGDATSDEVRFQNRLNLGPFDRANQNIASVEEDGQMDGASTATYDIPSSKFKFADSTAQVLLSTQQFDSVFLGLGIDAPTVELYSIWDIDSIDTAATYEVSRDGGTNWQTLTASRIGESDSYRALHNFTDEPSNAFNQEYAVAEATALKDLDDASVQEISQKFTVTDTTVYKNVIAYINKNQASSTGRFCVEIVQDDTGAPSTDINDIVWTSAGQNIDDLAVGNNVVNISSHFVIVAGDYHLVVRPDDAYRVAYTADNNDKISVRMDNTAGPVPNLRTYNGTVWAAEVANETAVYRLEGRVLDLRVRITSAATADDKFLRSYGIFYKYENGIEFTTPVFQEMARFDGTVDNFNEFILTNFMPDSRLLFVFARGTGQVFRYGDFVLDGFKVIFPVNTFNVVGTVELEFFQLGGVDGSVSTVVSDALLTANHLGSTDASIDKSSNGMGIFLRRPDGTLREIALDDDDNLVVYSV